MHRAWGGTERAPGGASVARLVAEERIACILGPEFAACERSTAPTGHEVLNSLCSSHPGPALGSGDTQHIEQDELH
jgi:hypothetical protein